MPGQKNKNRKRHKVTRTRKNANKKDDIYEALEAITEEQWSEVLLTSRNWTQKRISVLQKHNGHLLDAEAIVHEALSRIMKTGRGWDKKSYKSIINTMIYVAKGVINEKMTREMKRDVKYEKYLDKHTAEVKNIHPKDFLWLKRTAIDKLDSDDTMAKRIIELHFETPGITPAELSKKLGVDVKIIYNALKRIRRCLKAEELLTEVL